MLDGTGHAMHCIAINVFFNIAMRMSYLRFLNNYYVSLHLFMILLAIQISLLGFHLTLIT